MTEQREFQFDSRLLEHIKYDRGNEVKSMLNQDLVKTSDKWMNTLLHYAVLGNSANVVQHLVELGSEVDVPGKYGDTPLMLALRRVNRPAICYFNAQREFRDGVTASRMAWASTRLSVKILELLLGRLQSQTVDTEHFVDKLTFAGCNLLHCITHLKDAVQVIRCMLQRGSDVNSKDQYGSTALHLAVMHNDVELAKLLLDHGAEVNALNSSGYGPLWAAASNGNKDMMRVLLEAGAEPNATAIRINVSPILLVFNNFSRAPIDESNECLQLLFQHGAVPRNSSKLFDIALRKHDFKKINMLINHLVLLKELGIPVADSDFQCKQDTLRSTLPILVDSCRTFLKTVIFKNLTILQLLTDSDVKMRIHMRINGLMLTLQKLLLDEANKLIFPYYCSTLTKRITKARRIVELEDIAITIISKIMNSNHNQCYVAARMVAGYLNQLDLEQLSQIF